MSSQPAKWAVEATDGSINVTHEVSGRHFTFWRIDEAPFINLDIAIDADDAEIDNFGDILDEAINLALDYVDSEQKISNNHNTTEL